MNVYMKVFRYKDMPDGLGITEGIVLADSLESAETEVKNAYQEGDDHIYV